MLSRYIVRRLVATIPVMAVVTTMVFLLLRLTTGDPAAIIAGDNATAQDVAAVRAKLGLDRPIPGSTLWRAAVERRLADPSGGGPAEEILRRQLRESLERFPSLEVYWEWVRSGWRSAPRRKARW